MSRVYCVELEELEAKMTSSLTTFREGLPPPPVSAREIAAKKLSATDVRKLNKARRDAYKKYMAALDSITALEAALGIDHRWEPGTNEYIAAEKKVGERAWRRALDKLELLMVQRMFELSKAHAFGTGYKLREAIGKGLKARSSAIRTAVTKYNSAAAALVPPAPSVDFTTLMEWTQLQEFELLRHTRGGALSDRPWAQPANRLIAAKFYKIARAREELVRCRVEMRRLVTAMADEEELSLRVLSGLASTNRSLAHELARVTHLRMAANNVHRRRFTKLVQRFPPFADCFTSGVKVGGLADGRSGTRPSQSTTAEARQVQQDTPDVDDDLEEDEEGRQEEDGPIYTAIEDFISQLD